MNNQMALESSTGISPFPFLWVNRTMRVYHYSDIQVMAIAFPQLCVDLDILSLILFEVMAYQSTGYLHILTYSIALFSCQSSLMEQERGLLLQYI